MKTNKLPTKLFPFIWHFIKQQGSFFLLIQIFALGWAFDHTLWPYVLKLVIDTLTNFTGDRANVWIALFKPFAFGAALWISVELMFRFTGALLSHTIPKLEANIRMAMFDYVQRHSHSYFSNHFAGAITNKIADITQGVTRLLQLGMLLFVPVFLAIILSFIFFALLNPTFAYILISWVVVHFSIAFYFSKKCADLSDIHAEARSDLAGKIVDSLSNHSTARLFARYPYEYDYLLRFQKDEIHKNQASLWYVEKMKMFMGIACFLGAGVTMNWYMIYAWQEGNLTTGEVVYVFNTTWNIVSMTWLSSLELPNFFREIGVCKQALSLIVDPHEIEDALLAQPLKIQKGEISFKEVSFHYENGRALFEKKNLTIKPGEKVGLVGFSGSGKSTFVHLILRYFDIEKGTITIDGHDIRKVTQDSLRENIAFIPQDATLFHRTLKENVRFGKLDATDEEIKEASRKAHCEEFILQMPEQYETLVGERGVKLSGGQRQRIAIARAILKNAPILILDEATSSLDSVTESLIQDSLHLLMEGRTTIVIAHRLSTLAGMDRILVFSHGKLVEEGTHTELLHLEGHYAQMWGMQAGGFLPNTEEEGV